MSFNTCIASLDLMGKIPTTELRDVAAQYQSRGMAPEAALQRAVEDKLKMARMEERQIIAAVRSAWERQGGAQKVAKAAPATKTKPAKAREVTPRPDVAKTYTREQAMAEWDGASAGKRGMFLARVDARDSDLAGKDWEAMTPTEQALVRGAMDQDFDAPMWYINTMGRKVDKIPAAPAPVKTPAELAAEHARARWTDMAPRDRYTLLLQNGIGKDAEHGQFSAWDVLAPALRERIAASMAAPAVAKTTEQVKPANDDKFASNTIFTADAAAKARAVLRAKLGQLNAGIDPDMLQAGIMLAGAHIEAGARAFIDFSKAMIEDIGEGVRPFLRSFYEGVRHYPGIDGVGMSSAAEIDALPASTNATAPETHAAIGTTPTVRKKSKSAPGNAALRLDYGVDHIDGYEGSDEFPVDQNGDYPSGGIKGAFLKDAQRYLKDVAGQLAELGYAPTTDAKGKPMKAVTANPSGPAVAGAASLTMFNAEAGHGIYVTVAAGSMRGMVPTSRSGIAVMARVTNAGDPFGGAHNQWLDPSLTAKDLAEHMHGAVLRTAPATNSVTLPTTEEKEANHGQSDTGGASARALGDVAAEQDGGLDGGGRTERSDAGGRDSGAAADHAGSGERGEGARGDAGSAGPAHSADAGTATGGRLGDARARRARKSLPGDDARTGAGAQLTPAQAATAPVTVPASNFRITDALHLGEGGEVAKYKDNVAAIVTMKAIEGENRRATPAEQAIMARYVGWGGLANAFPSPETAQFKDAWTQRGRELMALLGPKEYAQARRSTLDSHYTSQTVVQAMWQAARHLGYQGGMALESSMGSGNFIGLIPDALAAQTRFTGVEYDNLTARIATLLYPQETVLNSGFQHVPLPDDAFDLAIGNPPFGEQSLRFQFKPELNGHSIHNQFFLASLDALKPGALQVQVVSRYLLDKVDPSSRRMLAKKAKLLGAIRLPDTAFKENARTSVVTDIVFLQRLTAQEQAHMDDVFAAAAAKPVKDRVLEAKRAELAAQVPAWVANATVKDPLGGEDMAVSSYFKANPHMILGTLERSGSMAYNNDITVRPDTSRTLAEQLAGAVARLPAGVMVQQPDAIAASIARHKDMSDALSIALEGHENGAVRIAPGGAMEQIVERETPEGGYELAKRTLTPASPWSDQLYMNSDGKWYTVAAVMGEDGKPVKEVKDGKATKRNVYERQVFASEADIPASMLLGQTRHDRLKELAGLRDLLKAQLTMEADDHATDAMEENRAQLAAAYAAFIKAHGLINEPANSALVANMPDGALVQALEFGYRPAISAARAARIKEKVRPASATPAPILSKRVIVPYEAPTTAATTADALAINMAESGRVDLHRIASLMGKSVADIEQEMADAQHPLLFKDPEAGQWATRNDYLSGQVKRKLNAARQAGLQQNIAALEEVQPEPWGAESVTALLGATWIPPKVYAAFVAHISGSPASVSFSALTNSFNVSAGERVSANEAEWGTTGYTAAGLISDLLNSNQVKVTGTDADGKTYVHQEYTALALLKAKAITSEFNDWVYKDGERRKELVDLFNEKFNTRVSRQHDGSHLALPGKVPDAVISMRRHQKNAIWRGIAERFMLVDHTVGAGKTFTAIARAMERRRMGLSQKPTMVVPNHMVEQFASDVYRLYPGAKVLAAGKKDFERSRRRQLFAKIATGDFDIVIIPHSSFGFIGIAPETEERYLQGEIDLAVQAVDDAQAEAEADGHTGFRKPFGVKEAERLVEKLTTRMEAIKAGRDKDRLLTFEQMGIDDLTVDEFHEFKNLFYSSRLTGVKGMGNKTGSQKAYDMYSKIRVLRDSPTGTVTAMTGTPISNSAVEMYTMMRYLAADQLKDMGLEHFDAWRAQFVSHDAGWEPNETGRLKEVNRLGRTWSNMRSLMDLYYSFTDSVDNDAIKAAYAEDNNGAAFPIPRVAGGDRRSVVIEPTPAQVKLLEDVIDGFDSLPNIVDPRERNIARLRLMDRARKVSLDVRAADPRSTSTEAGGKLDRIADEVKRIYTKWDSDRGTQLIFLDRSVPRAKGDDAILKEYDALVAAQLKAYDDGDEAAQRRVGESLERFDANEMDELRNAQHSGWNAYQQIKDNLIARGIPAAEIRFIQEANTDAQKQALFDAVNDGTVRVLIGSTPRMGAGTNVQKRIVAIHHADVTWKPSDIEQREGRGIRQGNSLLDKYGMDKFELEILAYATERTIDAKMWSLNSSKLRTINGIRKYDGAFSMDFEDEESVSMAELAALASGDPLLLERVKLMSEIDKLELLKRQHARKEWAIVSQIEDAEGAIARLPARIAATRDDLAAMNKATEALQASVAKRSVTVEGQAYTDGVKARAAVHAAVKAQQNGDDTAKVSIAVGNRRLSSQDGAWNAVATAMGDASPFVMTVRGNDFIARTDAQRAIAELAMRESGAMEAGTDKTLELGVFHGLPLSMTLVRGEHDSFYAQLALTRRDGSTFAAGDTNLRTDAAYTTSFMKSALDGLESTVSPDGLRRRIGYDEAKLASSEAALPELRARRGAGFPQQGELDAKGARLEQVITALSTPAQQAKPAVRVAFNPLRQPDGGYLRQAPALAFSRARIDTDDPLVNIYAQIAQDDDAFRLADSDKKSLAGVIADMAPGARVDDTLDAPDGDGPAAAADRVWMIDGDAAGNGRAFVFRDTKKKEIWLDISGWKEGRGGNRIYQAVATWAHNTGHRFIGDPSGLSDKALYRRTEQMISSALRHGTTEHLAPHARQSEALETSSGQAVRPLDWRAGDDAHNLRDMLVSSYTNVLHVFPEIASVHYNFAAGRFERDGAPVRPSADDVLAHQSAVGEHADAQGLGQGDDRGDGRRAAGRTDEVDGQLARVDAVPFTDADFDTLVKQVRGAYNVLFPSDGGNRTPPFGVSDLKRAVVTGSVLRGEGSAAGRATLDHVSERLLQRVSPQLAHLLYSRDAEYFRDTGGISLPEVPAGVDAGTHAPAELSGADLLAAKKSTEALNRELARHDMAPVRALRAAPNANFALARKIGEALGIDVNFVSNNGDFEGVAYKGIAYLAEGMRNPELAIAGHETLHALEQGNPELGARLRTQIRAYLNEGVVADRQAREYMASGMQDVSEEQAEAEVIADINGAMWTDPVFWRDLAKVDRSLFRQVAYKFMEVAAKMITTLRGSRFDVAALVRDVDAVRAIMVATWAEHASGLAERTAAPVMMSNDPSLVLVPVGQWLPNDAVAEEAEKHLGQLAHRPEIRVLDTAVGHLAGVTEHDRVSAAMDGAVLYLYRDMLPDLAAVQGAVFHELLHYGLRRFLTKGQYITRMKQLYMRDAFIRTQADHWANGLSGRRIEQQHGRSYALAQGVDEALARIAEPNAGVYLDNSLRAKVERTVQRWLASTAEWLGMPEAAAKWRAIKNEEARTLIQRVFSRLQTGAPGVADQGGAAFSRAGMLERLASAGNDVAALRLPADYRVGDLFNSSGKINWWHKTIGTMDNLAKRKPAFAPVYEAVQRFIGDVSRFAVVAADLAPTLLPKLENVADIIGKNRKKPLTAADTKAIGDPIFSGTLVWARDAHGNPVKIAELEAQAEQMTTAQKAKILLEKGIIDDDQNRAWLSNPLDMYDAIINSRFDETQLKAGVVWTDAELRDMFNLTDGQIKLYREFRSSLDKSLTNLTVSEMVKLGGKDAKGMLEQAVAAPDLQAASALLRDHFVALAKMHPEQTDMHLDTAQQIMNLADRGQGLMDRGYAPLSRFGKYTVYVQQGEEQVYFGMFESQFEASKMARDMQAEHPDAQVTHGTVSEDAYKLFAGVSPETIELFGSMVGLDSQADAASTEVYQTYLKLAKNNRSSMKRMIERKGITGFSEDAGRVLAGFIYSNARLTSGNTHLGEIDEAVTAIPKQQGELTDAAMKLREHIRNPEGGGAQLGGLMFAQFLGGSVASAMVNLTQPFTMTLPFLSQWGGIAKAGARVTAAYADMGKAETGDAGLDAALKWASDEGIVAPQEVHYLQAQAAGKGALRTGDGTTVGNTRAHLNNTMAKVSLGWGKLFAMAELTNRRVTFIAAYRTAVAEGIANPERFAQEAVAQTQGVYNSGNKPAWARGPIGGLLLTFKQYSIGYLELLSRMAFAGAPGSPERAAGRRGALYMVAVLFLMSGADGLPFEQDLEDALDGILQRLGYNFSTKRAKQAFLTETLGQGGADFVLKGLSATPGMPIDVAGRFGMGNLIPGTGLLTKKDSYTSDLGELAGPAGDLAKRAFTGTGKLLGGDLAGAALDVSPASVRNVVKGADMLQSGSYKDARGYKVNDTTDAEAVMKMVGFQPNSTADIQDAKGQALNMIAQNRMRSTEITEHWAQGLANGDKAMVDEARDMRDDWNAKNPDTPIKVNMPAVIKRVKAMHQDAAMRTQKTAPAALKQTVRRELAETRG